MCLFPRKYCNQTHIQSQLFQRQKMIFYNAKLIYTQNLKFYLNNFTELRNDFFYLRYLRLNRRSITIFLLNKPMGLFPSIYGITFKKIIIMHVSQNVSIRWEINFCDKNTC
jgi:hypothetical protein